MDVGVARADTIRNTRVRGTVKVVKSSRKLQQARLTRYDHVMKRDDECL